MIAPNNFLISLEERFSNSIFVGTKTVELRRRKMNIEPGSVIWIYVKVPVGSIVGHARVVKVHQLSTNGMWRKFGKKTGVTKAEFDNYFAGVDHGVAMELERATRLKSKITLSSLREIAGGFQPPQFFTRLKADHPLLASARA